MSVIGYFYDGDIYCENCISWDRPEDDDGLCAVFDTSETDFPHHCGNCRAFIGGAWLDTGFEEFKLDYLKGSWRNHELLLTYMGEYDYFDWFFIPTFVGLMNPLHEFKDFD